MIRNFEREMHMSHKTFFFQEEKEKKEKRKKKI